MSAKWVPVAAADKCVGCGRCVEVCGAKCLEIVGGDRRIASPRRMRK